MADLTPLTLSEEELEAIAAIAPQDILAARQAWKQHAPRGWKDLLDAEPEMNVGTLNDGLPLE